MSTIDDLLARSLQLKDPQIPSDTVAYDDTAYPDMSSEGVPLAESWGRDLADDTAAAHLRSLCEAAVTHSPPEQIADFITEQVPAPRGAWILGCLLHLAEAEDGARFWWQYAAGAGDTAASYCLYLHHRALGDRHAAAFWHDQTDNAASEDQAGYRPTIEDSVPVFLRILEHLTPATGRAHTDATLAVMDYVAAAVTAGYARHPEYEIPLPGPYFAEHIEIILAATSTTPRKHRGRQPARDLPARLALGPDSDTADRPEEQQEEPEPDRVLVEVAAADAESASAFREAVAACWEGVTTERTVRDREAGPPGLRLRYYLDRRPLTDRHQASRTRTTQPS
ncbi:DUF6207 family protein [Streptomyces lutosisoli]|uniref:DUF6207 family protein n=1 Tax=Streptomyces lutosisoli TaxID=2665721 RepID=A0ABW2VYQ7_9ACTN